MYFSLSCTMTVQQKGKGGKSILFTFGKAPVAVLLVVAFLL